jgi:hypothetical protein
VQSDIDCISIFEQNSARYGDALADIYSTHCDNLVILCEANFDRSRFEGPSPNLDEYQIPVIPADQGSNRDDWRAVSIGPRKVASANMFGFNRLAGFCNSILTLRL